MEEQRECGEAEQRTSADPAFTTGSLEYVDGKRQVEYKGSEQAWNVAAQNQGGSDMQEDVQQHDGLEAQQKKNAATPTSVEVAARCDQEREDRHWKQDHQELRIRQFSQKWTQRRGDEIGIKRKEARHRQRLLQVVHQQENRN